MPALYTHTTRANGTVLTATIYNGDHQNHINNGDASQLGGDSANVASMQIQTSPGGVGTESLPSNIAGELERIRFVLAQMKGTTYWYDPGSQSNSLISVRVITATGTYTPTVGTRSVIVELCGGGGAGGGMPAGLANGTAGAGSGAGAGGYARKRITSAFSGVTVTIGAGGTGVSGASGNGGGATSFGAIFSANGGAPGIAGVAGVIAQVMQNGGLGGTASGGDINVQGGRGYDSLGMSGTSATPGAGGINCFGAGGGGVGGNGAPLSRNGENGYAYGTGGSGGVTVSAGGSGANAGGGGQPGICIIYEYA